jgi:hypothetical protein
VALRRLIVETTELYALQFSLAPHFSAVIRGQPIYGNTAPPNSDFGSFVNGVGTATKAIPAFANIDPPRAFQLQVRFIF